MSLLLGLWRSVYPDFTVSFAAVANGGFCLPAGGTLKCMRPIVPKVMEVVVARLSATVTRRTNLHELAHRFPLCSGGCKLASTGRYKLRAACATLVSVKPVADANRGSKRTLPRRASPPRMMRSAEKRERQRWFNGSMTFILIGRTGTPNR